MYLFTRQARLAPGHAVDGLEWAISLTEKVNQITSIDVGLWTSTMSPAVGTVSWGAAVESLGDLEDAEAKLMVDPMFLDAIQRGATLTTGQLDDRVAQFVTNPTANPNATHVAVVVSQIANGCFQKGIEAGIEIATKATELGGSPTAFLLGVTGNYAECVWISSAASLRELEASEQAVNTSPEFLALVDSASANYLPGVTTQSIWRRIV